MAKDEKGSIVVETIGSFTLFVFMCISIIMLINITVVQQRVHYALTQTAIELSMYSYVIHVLGLSDFFREMDATGQEVQGQIDSVINDINTIRSGGSAAASAGSPAELFGNIETVLNSIGSLAQTGGSALDDPGETIFNLLIYGLDRAQKYVVQEFVIRPMINKYLTLGTVDANTFLQNFNVREHNGVMLDISDSVFINSNGSIVIVAEYSIDFTFGTLPLPDAVRILTFRQTAKTRAWLGGHTP